MITMLIVPLEKGRRSTMPRHRQRGSFWRVALRRSGGCRRKKGRLRFEATLRGGRVVR
jgi:hypothetical protein